MNSSRCSSSIPASVRNDRSVAILDGGGAAFPTRQHPRRGARKRISTVQAFVGLAAALAMAGCATSSATKAAIKEFANATAAANQGLQALDETTAARLETVQRKRVLERPIRIGKKEGTCLATAASCILVYKKKRDEKEPAPFAPTSLIPAQREIMNTIAAYADGLAAIQAADATEEMNAAIDSVAGDIAKLAALIPVYGPPVAAVVPAIGRAAKFGFRLAQERIKHNATLEAVQAMHQILPEAVKLMEDTAKFGNLPSRRVLTDVYDAAEEKFWADKREASLDALVTAAKQLDAVLALDPGLVFGKLGKAHESLHLALTDPKVNLASALEAIQAFALEANHALAIASDLRNAVDKASAARDDN